MSRTLVLASALLVLAAAVAPAGASSPSSSASPSRCQTSSTNATCSFACAAGDIIAASGIGGGANATCGGATAACDDPVDCLDGGRAASSNGTGTCRKTTESGEYADCFALPAPRAHACGTAVDYGACSFACGAGDDLVARANSTNASGGWPRVLSLCGGTHVDCQAWNACEANGTAFAAGEGVFLSRTVATNVTCSATAANGTAPAPQNDAGSGGDAPEFWWGGRSLAVFAGTYSGELRPAEGDHQDAYSAYVNDHGRASCPDGDYRVHVEGAGVQVRIAYSTFLDTPADFRSNSCLVWAVEPTSAHANATTPLAYSMTVTTPTAPAAPDFVVSGLTVNGTPAIGAVVPVSFVVTNAGDLAANGTAQVSVRGNVGVDTLASVRVTLAPGESVLVNASWSTTGDVGHVTVVANAWPSDRDTNPSNNEQRRDVRIGGVDGPGVVAGPQVRSILATDPNATADRLLRSVLAVAGSLVPDTTNASPERPVGSALAAIDGECANPTISFVESSVGSISPRACDDYSGRHGGPYVPVLGVRVCDATQGSTIYRTIAEHIGDKPPCSPSVRDIAWAEAAILDPVVGSVVDGVPS